MIIFSAYNIIYLICFPLFVQLIQSAPNPLDELTINVNIGGSQDESPTIWAVLAAGTEGWWNYRHQADVCHAYQVLHEHGVDDDHIIVMMIDDIAYNPENPFPGNIINRPGGPNVYTGVPKDYTGNNVTPQVFLSVLQGNKSAVSGKLSGKVVESGPNDHIFVFFSGHGIPGVIPLNYESLMASELNKTIGKMKEENKFGKFLFYMEACDSGSMFKGLLPNNIDVLAVTASNATELSYSCYYDKTRKTILGDVFSVNWMEDSDRRNILEWSVNQQIAIVKNKTTRSSVSQYGDASIGNLMVGQFQGMNGHVADDYQGEITDAVPSCEVPLKMIQNIKGPRMEEEINQLMKNRKFVDDVMKNIALRVLGDRRAAKEIMIGVNEITNFNCHDNAVRKFHESCFNLGKNEYAGRKVQVLVNLCEAPQVNEEDISSAIEEVCTHSQVVGII